MRDLQLIRAMLWLVAGGTVVVGIIGGRYFLTPVELRIPSSDALWYVVPLLLVLLLSVVMLVLTRQSNTPNG